MQYKLNLQVSLKEFFSQKKLVEILNERCREICNFLQKFNLKTLKFVQESVFPKHFRDVFTNKKKHIYADKTKVSLIHKVVLILLTKKKS